MADFTPEEVIQVVLDGRKCRGANLQDIDLVKADLIGANLTEADLTGANLFRAILFRANLPGAILSGANLIRADLSLARYDANTQWPEGFDPEAEGAVLVEDDD